MPLLFDGKGPANETDCRYIVKGDISLFCVAVLLLKLVKVLNYIAVM